MTEDVKGHYTDPGILIILRPKKTDIVALISYNLFKFNSQISRRDFLYRDKIKRSNLPSAPAPTTSVATPYIFCRHNHILRLNGFSSDSVAAPHQHRKKYIHSLLRYEIPGEKDYVLLLTRNGYIRQSSRFPPV